MKKVIVYYSLEGNTEYIADKLSEVLGAGKVRLVPEKAYADKGFAKYFWGGKSAVMAEKAFGKLRSLLEIDDFYGTAVFFDPKNRPSEENEMRLNSFIEKLR